jgi:hypothetical protein
MIYFFYFKIPIRHHHRHNFVTDIDPRLTRALPIRDVRPTLLTLITNSTNGVGCLMLRRIFLRPNGAKSP